jgi:[histone H3]-trimethyl-L-lysine4 demethylase
MLCSINRHIYGSPKVWFFINQEDNKKYEEFILNQETRKKKTCNKIFKHKCFIVAPEVLAENGIRVIKVIQNVGEYIVTFADVYHMGYNTGFNINEAVNFMLYSDIKLNLECNKRIQLDNVSIFILLH